jgi:prepilin-type processing-associated H-X9-DG protein
LYYGWWFAGAGYDGSSSRGTAGTGDVLLGARDSEMACDGAITDGNGNSLSNCPQGNVGLKPGNINNPCDQTHFWSFHSGGANFLNGDGSVRFLNYNIDPDASMTSVFVALCTRDGGEAVTLP